MTIGPTHSIICSFTGTGHGAAAWMMASSDDRSAFSRTSGGSFSSRENIVGTIWTCVTRCSATSSRNRAASKCSMITAVPPRRTVMATLACGAEWYSGAGERYVIPSRKRYMNFTKSMTGNGSPGAPRRQRPQDALRLPGRARRVQHRRAQLLVGDGFGREAGDGVLVALVAVRHGRALGDVGDQPPLDVRALLRQVRGHVELRRGGDEDPRLAVVDDVRRLLRREVAVDARVVEAGPLGSSLGLEHAHVVLHQERDVVGPTEPVRAEEAGHLVGPPLVLRVGHDQSAVRHDEQRLVRMVACVLSGVHAGSPGSAETVVTPLRHALR